MKHQSKALHRIIEPNPAHRGVMVRDAWLDQQEAQALASDVMRLVLLISASGQVTKIRGPK